MKFMKLGSRPDTFHTSDSLRSVSSEVSSDLIIQVKGSRFLLHKFPLLSKCLRLQRLCSELPEPSQLQTIQLPDFPGGPEAFELCAKFCYGITITLSAHNIIPARCAAEYLQMTEDVERGNLILKIEAFFGSCILSGWRDSLVALHTTKQLPVWSEELGITSRLIEALATMVSARPAKVSLSRTRSRRAADDDASSCGGGPHRTGWWADDMAELGIDLYWRTMVAVRGRVPPALAGDALRAYASRWLPDVRAGPGPGPDKHRLLLESIVSLLPGEKGAVSCGFLLKLLKAANVLRASLSTRSELARRIGLQLEEASAGDLLIPSLSDEIAYDVDIVIEILLEFMAGQGRSPPTSPGRRKEGGFERRRSRSAENVEAMYQERRRSSSGSHGSRVKVARLVDRYLQRVAKDPSLAMSKFIAVAEAVPEFTRLDHDDLYKAIDVYLKGHPELSKSERKQICRLLDCKKLSVEACMHAAQNEMLPLRVVVQVLFFEQARAAMSGSHVVELPSNIKALLAVRKNPSNAAAAAEWGVSGLKSPDSNISTLKMKLDEEEDEGTAKSSKTKAFTMTPHRPSKKMLGKLWPISRSASQKN